MICSPRRSWYRIPPNKRNSLHNIKMLMLTQTYPLHNPERELTRREVTQIYMGVPPTRSLCLLLRSLAFEQRVFILAVVWFRRLRNVDENAQSCRSLLRKEIFVFVLSFMAVTKRVVIKRDPKKSYVKKTKMLRHWMSPFLHRKREHFVLVRKEQQFCSLIQKIIRN